MTAKQKEKMEAIEYLQSLIIPGQKIYTKLNHVSRSGMYRVIDCYIIQNNELLRISYSVAKALDYRYDRKHEGIGVSGVGMDMGYSIVHDLSYVLFPNGFECIGENCPHNSHNNPPYPKKEAGLFHEKSGYVLNHSWI